MFLNMSCSISGSYRVQLYADNGVIRTVMSSARLRVRQVGWVNVVKETRSPCKPVQRPAISRYGQLIVTSQNKDTYWQAIFATLVLLNLNCVLGYFDISVMMLQRSQLSIYEGIREKTDIKDGSNATKSIFFAII